MASENETVAAAIAAERRRIERAKADAEEDLEIECVFTDNEVGEIIDRVEAAYMREKAELRERLKETARPECADLDGHCSRCARIGVCLRPGRDKAN